MPLLHTSAHVGDALHNSLRVGQLVDERPRLIKDPIGPVIHSHLEAALNPQPLPPAEIGAGVREHPGQLAALNPQPLPPGEVGHGSSLLASLFASRFQEVALNPQPLPPGPDDKMPQMLRSAAAESKFSLFQPGDPCFEIAGKTSHSMAEALRSAAAELVAGTPGDPCVQAADEFCDIGRVVPPVPNPFGSIDALLHKQS